MSESEDESGCIELPEGVLIDMITNNYSIGQRRVCETCKLIKKDRMCGYGFVDCDDGYIFGWETFDSQKSLENQKRRLGAMSNVLAGRNEGTDKKVCAHINVIDGDSSVLHMIHLFSK